jgi:hypothetical protein
MAQKCMATPAAIADIKYKLGDLAHVYEVAPDFSARLIRARPQLDDARGYLGAVLREDWGFDPAPEDLARIAELMGV